MIDRPRLAEGLGRPVELAPAEGVAADHGLDLPGRRVDDQEGALDQGLLVQRHRQLPLLGRDRLHLDLDDVPGPDQGIEVPGPGPFDPFARHPADAVLEPDVGLRLPGAQDDGVRDLAGLDGVSRPALQPDGTDVGRPLREKVLLVPPPAPLLVQGPEPRLQGVLGELLELGIEGRMDLEAGVVEGVGAVVLFEVPADLLEEIGPELGRSSGGEAGR